MDRPNEEYIEISLKEHFVKIDSAGKAWCKLCLTVINYSNRGSKALSEHSQTIAHTAKVKTKAQHRPLEVFRQNGQNPTSVSGGAENQNNLDRYMVNTATGSEGKQHQEKATVRNRQEIMKVIK